MKKPWPTKDAMEQIYERNLWGGEEDAFYSGLGSHHPKLVEPYIEVVKEFLQSFKEPLTVCDLGCGDFNVGQQLLDYAGGIVAVDIVEDLIERNKGKFRNEQVDFHCMDIAKDELPAGDCVLLRNVLQHLSNAEVQQIVQKLDRYNYVILTEHLPEGNFEPNKDIISGQGIRLKKQSGIDITASPFHFKAKEAKEVLSVPYPDGEGKVVTTLYRL